MEKIIYRAIYNKKKTLNAHGTALLQIEAQLNHKKIYFSSHIYLRPDQWDEKKELIKNHPNAESLNYMIRDFIVRLEQKEIELWKNNKKITLGILKSKFSSNEKTSFLSFIKDEINSSKTKKSTQINKLSTLSLLVQFKSSIDFKDIDSRFVHNFESFLYKIGYQTNTIAKHMKHLRTFVNAAIDKEYIDTAEYAFRRYKIKTCNGKHAFLLPEELAKLEKLELPYKSRSLQHTLDAFLFCCYTGLRYSDFTNLTEQNIKTIEGNPWIILQTIKTGVEVKLPLGLLFEGKAWILLRKYRQNWNTFFQLKPNSTVNKELIRLRKLASIQKHFSFHTARHTNATLLIYKGANITTVQKLLGHRNVLTTQIYSEVMSSTIIKDLKRCSHNRD